MRKKLLALLMCATMVLGTSVTAMAAVKDDAKKLGVENAKKFIDEYYPTAKTLVSKTQNGTKGLVEYGYLNDVDADDVLGDYTPVVVYSKDDVYHPATWVYSNAGKLKAYETKEVKGTAASGGKITIQQAIDATSFDESKNFVYTDATATTKATLTDNTAVSTTYYDKDGNIIVKTGTNGSVTAITSAQAADQAAAAVAAKIGDAGQPVYAAMTVYDDNGASSVMIAKEATGSSAKVDGFVTNTNNYVKKDSGAGALVEAGDSFIKTAESFGTVYSNIVAAGAEFLTDGTTSVEYALNNKVFTKDAVAVKVYSFVQGPAATENVLNLEGAATATLAKGYAKPLYNYTKLQGGTYTFDSDLISRTAFKNAEAVAVFQPSLFQTKFDIETGAQYYEFNKVAEVAVNEVITFDLAPTYVDGQVFIFDKGELAAEPEADKNDGVSDTTATTDNTTSPKTGDVAPIAALAVVMMGAFGAMVVASKKRA